MCKGTGDGGRANKLVPSREKGGGGTGLRAGVGGAKNVRVGDSGSVPTAFLT